MKKIYVSPEVEVVKLQTMAMMVSSPEVEGEYNGETVEGSEFFDEEDGEDW
jgi:hypothetical protein